MRKLGIVLAMIGLLATQLRAANTELMVYCAAGIRAPVQKLIDKYQVEHKDVKIIVDYKGSGSQVSSILVNKKGDLMILGNGKFIKRLKKADLISDSSIIAYHTPVIAVEKGNPKHIKGLKDFLRRDITYSLGDEKLMALGFVEHSVFERMEIWEQVSKNARVRTVSAPQTLNYLKLNVTDVAIIWKSNVINKPDIQYIEDKNLSALAQEVPIILLSTSQEKKKARELYEYLLSNRGIFKEYGYELEK